MTYFEFNERKAKAVSFPLIEYDGPAQESCVEVHPQTPHETFEALMSMPVEEGK